MNNDLISRSKLLDALDLSECHNCRFGGEYCVDCKAIDAHKVLDEIINQPTAYDVNKVISEIDKCSIDNTDWGYSTNPKLASYYLSRTAEVIDIVKRGGVK